MTDDKIERMIFRGMVIECCADGVYCDGEKVRITPTIDEALVYVSNMYFSTQPFNIEIAAMEGRDG